MMLPASQPLPFRKVGISVSTLSGGWAGLMCWTRVLKEVVNVFSEQHNPAKCKKWLGSKAPLAIFGRCHSPGVILWHPWLMTDTHGRHLERSQVFHAWQWPALLPAGPSHGTGGLWRLLGIHSPASSTELLQSSRAAPQTSSVGSRSNRHRNNLRYFPSLSCCSHLPDFAKKGDFEMVNCAAALVRLICGNWWTQSWNCSKTECVPNYVKSQLSPTFPPSLPPDNFLIGNNC